MQGPERQRSSAQARARELVREPGPVQVQVQVRVLKSRSERVREPGLVQPTEQEQAHSWFGPLAARVWAGRASRRLNW